MIKPVFTFGLPSDAKALREEVFVQEQGFQNEFGPEDDRCWSLVLYLDDRPIATGRILEIDPETYQIGRVAVKKRIPWENSRNCYFKIPHHQSSDVRSQKNGFKRPIG